MAALPRQELQEPFYDFFSGLLPSRQTLLSQVKASVTTLSIGSNLANLAKNKGPCDEICGLSDFSAELHADSQSLSSEEHEGKKAEEQHRILGTSNCKETAQIVRSFIPIEAAEASSIQGKDIPWSILLGQKIDSTHKSQANSKRNLNDHSSFLQEPKPTLNPLQDAAVCLISNKDVKSLNKYNQQAESDTQVSRSSGHIFKCEFCALSFKYRYKFKRHTRTHSKAPKPLLEMKEDRQSKSFECSVCSKRLSSLGTLIRHCETVCFQRKVFNCDLCSKRFWLEAPLEKHKKKHLAMAAFAERGLQHKDCESVFQDVDGGKSCESQSINFYGAQQVSSKVQPLLSICKLCNQNFNSKSLFKLHIVKHIEPKE